MFDFAFVYKNSVFFAKFSLVLHNFHFFAKFSHKIFALFFRKIFAKQIETNFRIFRERTNETENEAKWSRTMQNFRETSFPFRWKPWIPPIDLYLISNKKDNNVFPKFEKNVS